MKLREQRAPGFALHPRATRPSGDDPLPQRPERPAAERRRGRPRFVAARPKLDTLRRRYGTLFLDVCGGRRVP